MLPQNLYGPMIKKNRLAQNMSIDHLTDLVNGKGLSFTPEKVQKIEEQQIKLYDYEGEEDDHKELYQEECRTMLLKYLNKLTDRQRDVLILRFGLDPDIADKPLTLEETGKILGITKERVHQLETMALSRLRRMPGITALYAYVEL